MAGERRCEVTRFNASHKRLFNIIPPEGLELPASARERLLEAVAGLSAATAFANRNGETVQAQRDLKAERAAVQELIAACPLLAALGGEQQSITLPQPLDCLEMLEQVHAAEARCLWPGAESFKIAAHTQPRSLKLNVKPGSRHPVGWSSTRTGYLTCANCLRHWINNPTRAFSNLKTANLLR